MHKQLILIFFLQLNACNNGDLINLADLPKTLNEVSGIETIKNLSLIWMITDAGNAQILYGVDDKGAVKKELEIKAKNNDWEDLTSDDEGNIYIGDFGNNDNDRKNLTILKIKNESLNNSDEVTVESIAFQYPDQDKFPPKKKDYYFDCEAFFYYQDSLFLFTKSRVKNNYGQTNIYKLPAKPGNYTAEFIGSFNAGSDKNSWITAADISDDGRKIVLLSSKSVWIFSNYEGSNFLTGTSTELDLNHISQKEGVCFINNNTLYITDEKDSSSHANLYSFKL